MVIKEDKEGNKYVEVKGEKFYIFNTVGETIDDIINLLNYLRQIEKIIGKYEDEELIDMIHKKIEYYSTVLKEIYGD